MRRSDVIVDTPDGTCAATLHTPDDAGPWPGVLYYPDAVGVREVFRVMADTLAESGYSVLLPDIYYRTPYTPFDTSTLFDDPAEFGRLHELGATLAPDRVVTDARVYLSALTARPEVAAGGLGVVGYCFGGQMALRAAAHHPDLITAAATFHGANLAVADDPSSPHLLVDWIRAAVYVAGATDDAVFDDTQRDRLQQAFDDSGVAGVIETYPAAHGFAVSDNPTYDADADRRHREATVDLLASRLGG